MKLKKVKPVTPGTRHQKNLVRNVLSKFNRLLKSKSKRKIVRNGKSATSGRITSWHKGGSGLRKIYRNIDNSKGDYNSILVSVQYDSFRSSLVGVCFDLSSREFFYVLLPRKVYPGCLLVSSSRISEYKIGFRSTLGSLPPGSFVNDLCTENSFKSYIRSAGTSGNLIQRGKDFSSIKLPSGLVVSIPSTSYATIGSLSNSDHGGVIWGKAGRKRLLGRRPIVRGVAMNPVDHPHGGRTNGGRPSVSPWGIKTKSGFKLVKKNIL